MEGDDAELAPATALRALGPLGNGLEAGGSSGRRGRLNEGALGRDAKGKDEGCEGERLPPPNLNDRGADGGGLDGKDGPD